MGVTFGWPAEAVFISWVACAAVEGTGAEWGHARGGLHPTSLMYKQGVVCRGSGAIAPGQVSPVDGGAPSSRPQQGVFAAALLVDEGEGVALVSVELEPTLPRSDGEGPKF